MRKTLTYPAFVVISLFIVLIFITAKTYTQLIIAIVAYIPLAYFTLKIFPRRTHKSKVVIELPSLQKVKVKSHRKEESIKPVEIADIDKRAFLKLVGATGLSIFIFAIFGRRVESLLFGNNNVSPISPAPGATSSNINPNQSPVSQGYSIAEIDDGVITYYGFINSVGAWLIMKEDTNVNSFRYAKGGTSFPKNWSNRQNLTYDYFYNLF